MWTHIAFVVSFINGLKFDSQFLKAQPASARLLIFLIIRFPSSFTLPLKFRHCLFCALFDTSYHWLHRQEVPVSLSKDFYALSLLTRTMVPVSRAGESPLIIFFFTIERTDFMGGQRLSSLAYGAVSNISSAFPQLVIRLESVGGKNFRRKFTPFVLNLVDQRRASMRHFCMIFKRTSITTWEKNSESLI